MKAGDKVIWKANDTQTYECDIIAVYRVEDAINKSMLGKRVFRVSYNGHDFHAVEGQLKPIK